MLRSVESICHDQNPVVSPLRLDVKANPLREGRDHLERFEEDIGFSVVLLPFLDHDHDRVINAPRIKDNGQFSSIHDTVLTALTDTEILEILSRYEKATAVTVENKNISRRDLG